MKTTALHKIKRIVEASISGLDYPQIYNEIYMELRLDLWPTEIDELTNKE